MFITLSYTAHTIISISLHVIGIVVGLFVWYLFPKHPTRSIVQLPSERVALCIETQISTKLELMEEQSGHQSVQNINFPPNSSNTHENVEKLIHFDDHHLPQFTAIRQFG